MRLIAQEIAELVQGEIVGEKETPVSGVAGIEEATGDDLSYLSDLKYLKNAAHSLAGVLLAKRGTALSNRTVIFVDNPQIAFLKILRLFAKDKEAKPAGIHPSAVIAKDAVLGAGVSVGAHSV